MEICANEQVQQLYGDGHVHNWHGSKDPSTVQLLLDT